MSSINASRRIFLAHMFAAFMVFQGKASMTNLSRYMPVNEKRFRRHFERDFDHAQFNTQLFHKTNILGEEVIAAIDASFIKKSGKKTQGLNWFYNGTAGCMQKGLEISLLALVDIQTNTAYSLEAQQTLDQPDQTRMDSYANQILKHAPALQQLGVQYLTADAYYSKSSFVSKVLDSKIHFIGKLRFDANLKWLYQGAYSGYGRPKKYEGKVDFDQEIHRFDNVGILENGEHLYSKVVYSPMLKRTIKLVMIRRLNQKGVARVLLYSTDTELSARKIVQYYKARFQIEFIFRDAKQQLGLSHCQSRKKAVIDNHINASLTTLNILKIEHQHSKSAKTAKVISIQSCKQKKSNQHLAQILFDKLGADLSCQKVRRIYHEVSEYALIAA